MGYEYKLQKLTSLKLDASLIYILRDNYYFTNTTNVMVGTNIGLSFRKYFFYNQIINKKRSENFWAVYVSPYAEYQYIQRNYSFIGYDMVNQVNLYDKSHQNAITPGILTGMRFDLAKGLISFDFNVGFGVKFSKITGGHTNYSNYFNPIEHNYGRNGFVPNGNIALGFNF